MRRAVVRTERRRARPVVVGAGRAFAVCALCALAAPNSVARAEFEPTGALSAGFLVQSGGRGEQRGLGGGIAVDLWQRFGSLRVGLYGGVHTVTGSDEQSIVFTPLAASLAVALEASSTMFEIRIRGGGFGAAMHERGLLGGLYLGSGVFLDFEVSPRARLGVGGELHLLVERDGGSRALFSPSITLVYRPEVRVED